MKAKAFCIVIIVLMGLRLLTMALTPVFDPSESRYAVMAANMARGGDFVVPHFTYRGRYQSFDGKPPLVFQAGGLCCKALGVSEFAVRLFPFSCAVLLGWLVYLTVRRLSNAERARLAVCVYGSSAAFYATAGFAMTDVPLATSVAGSLLLYRLFCEREQLRYALGVAFLLGAGMLIKGPVSLVLFGLPVLADAFANHHWRKIFNTKWLCALPVYLIVAVPWFVLVEQCNPGAVEYFFVNENFKRFLVHEYGDRYGAGRETFRGMAIVWAFLATLPWAFLPLGPLLRRPREVRLPIRDFFVLAVLAMTAFWCLTSRTLISYLLPVTPVFAAWVALSFDRALLSRLVPWVSGVVAIGLAAGLLVAPAFSDKMQGAASPQFYGFRNRYSHEFYHGTARECVGSGTDVGALEQKARLAAGRKAK